MVSQSVASGRAPRRLRTLGMVAVAAVVLGSCSGSDGARSTRGTTTTQASSTPPTSTPQHGGPTTSAPPNFPQRFEPKRDHSLDTLDVTAAKVLTLDAPVALTGRFGTHDLYVAQRAGKVIVLPRTSSGGVIGKPTVALDISAQTTTDSNRGMVGIAFSADGTQLYVSHTNAAGDSRVARYTMDGVRADPTSRVEILKIKQPYDDHNVDAIHFGPDGKLWVATGDGGGLNDPDQRAQDPTDLLGKVLRIDPASPARPQVWARGLRNPYRFSFDRKTGDLWLGDVGQEATEEIDFLPAGTAAGTNFGWSGFEGTTVKFPDRADPKSVPPVFEMAHSQGWCAVVGGVVYRGRSIPALDGVYLFGDVCQKNVHVLRLADGAVTDQRALDVKVDHLVSIDQDLDGEVWLLSLDGGVYRLQSAKATAPG